VFGRVGIVLDSKNGRKWNFWTLRVILQTVGIGKKG
jgi:hypothetical protein